MEQARHYTSDPWYLISRCLRRQGRDPDCFRRLLEPERKKICSAAAEKHRPPPSLENLVHALPYLDADARTMEKLDDAYDGELRPRLKTPGRTAGPVPFAPLRALNRFSPRKTALDDYLLANSCELHAGGPAGKGVCLLLVEPGASPLEQFPGSRLWIGAREAIQPGSLVLAAARDGSFLLRMLKFLPEGKVLLPPAGGAKMPPLGPEQVRRRIRWILPVLAAEIRLHG